MIGLRKFIIRDLDFMYRRQWLVVRVAPEGVYLKGKKQRWTSSYLLPWAAAYDVAVKMKIADERVAKAKARKERRG